MVWTKENGLASEGVGPAGRPAQALHKASSGHSEVVISTGFIRFFDMAECHVVYSEKPNAFLIILEAILRFGLQNDQISTGFIRYFDQLFWLLQNVVLLTVF